MLQCQGARIIRHRDIAVEDGWSAPREGRVGDGVMAAKAFFRDKWGTNDHGTNGYGKEGTN
jgi:hypothetical protein